MRTGLPGGISSAAGESGGGGGGGGGGNCFCKWMHGWNPILMK